MAALYSPATLEQVRSANDIVDVIGSYVHLKRAGANFVALCPFHKEKTPSFNVNPQKQIFRCFGCGKGGNVITFIMEHEGLPFPDAVRRLAERAKIPLETERDPNWQQNRHIKETLLQIHEQIAQRWQNALATEASGQPARDYLVERGVSEDAVKLFRLGYAPDVWDDTVNWAKSKGYELPIVEQAGLILRKEGAESHYDRFRGRLMFPICDEQGRVIGFSGRVLDPEVKTAKYVNSPETPIFTKGKVFFGLDKSKRALLDKEEAIICEGQLDLIACYMAGVQNIVAPQGTALTSEHARILKRYVSLVVVCFDADTAGWSATIRSLDGLIEAGLLVLVAVIPAPHDPDSFIKSFGSKAFEELIGRAQNFFDFYLNRLCSSNDTTTDKGRQGVLTGMLEILEKIYKNNRVLWDTYAQKTALRLGVTAEAVRAEFKKVGRTKATSPLTAEDAPESESPPEIARPNVWECSLLKLSLLNDETIDWVRGHLDMNWVQHPHIREIMTLRLAAQADGSWQGVAAFLTHCENGEMSNLITEVTVEDRPTPNPSQQLTDILLQLRNQFIDRQLTAIKQRVGQPDLEEAGQLDLLRQQQELRQLKREPLTPLSGSADEPF